jgi:hypothetical protein
VVEHGTPSPLAVYREDPLLFLLTLGAAATSIAALLLQLAGIIRMPYTLSFVTAPGMIFLLGVQIRAGRAGRPLIVNRLRVGLVAGLIGLMVYNGTRWVMGTLLSLSTSPFYSIFIFGHARPLVGQVASSPARARARRTDRVPDSARLAIRPTGIIRRHDDVAPVSGRHSGTVLPRHGARRSVHRPAVA